MASPKTKTVPPRKPVTPNTESLESIMPLLNTGCGFDLLTGKWLKLDDGSYIILGGLARYWSIGGPPNSYKTALLLFFHLAPSDNLTHIAAPSTFTYDTENSYVISRLHEILKKFKGLFDLNFAYSGMWTIVPKHMKLADLWWEDVKDWFKAIVKEKFMVSTPMTDIKTGKPFRMFFPSFLPIDSISQVESTTAHELAEKKLGDSKAKMYYINVGFDKSRILGELGTLVYKAGAYTLLSTHIGDENMMSNQRFPTKEFTDSAAGQILKGVPKNFSYLLTHIWLTNTAKVSHVDHMEKYPKKQTLKLTPKGDLVTVKMTLVRSKTSRSGHTKDVYISQSAGVQAHLTNIIELKEECDNYGIVGNNVRYAMDLYPKAIMMRTTLREKIDNDVKLRRAIDITTEMYQTFSLFLYDNPNVICTPAQLREELEEKGYCWDTILESRGFWTVEDDKHPVPRLSTMDLLNIRIGEFTAPWAMKTKDTAKKSKV